MNRAVLLTRHPAECGDLQDLLEPSGISVRPFPVLRIEDVDDKTAWRLLTQLIDQDRPNNWLVMASPRAPRRVVRMARHHAAATLLNWPVAVVGAATAAAAAEVEMDVEVVGPGTGAGLARELIEILEPEARVVLAGGKDRRPELPDALEAAGHRVHPVVVYAMKPTPPRELPPLGPNLEAVIVTSPRAARLYLEAVGGHPLPLQHWALGPTTQNAAASMGIHCLIPTQPTMNSLAEEICRT